METVCHIIRGMILVGALATSAVGAVAAGGEPQPTTRPPEADSPAPTATSASFTLAIRVASSTGRGASCRDNRVLAAVGPSLLAKASYTVLDRECLACCNEYIFADDFETGDTVNWSAVVGG